MALPIATRKTAFVAGASLSVLIFVLQILNARGVIPYDADSPQLFPFVLVYFFVSVLVYVTGLQSFAPKELKTRFAGVYFPTNREGVTFMVSVWGRMLVWFFGAAATGGLLTLAQAVLK